MLAKRAGYHCSNPFCRKLTIGANELHDKSTSIGIAAHITAASSQGPRFDSSLTEDQRKHIDNAIWLCSNCATLIDKDEEKYTIEILRKWKKEVEDESRKKLNSEKLTQPNGIPFLEAELIIVNRSANNIAYSDKKTTEIHDGRTVQVRANPPIIHWKLAWNFKLVIYNNSNYPAFNVKIESVGSVHFNELTKLPAVNNISPLENLVLKARFEDSVEGNHLMADGIMNAPFPRNLYGLKFQLTFQDKMRIIHSNEIEFTETGIVNSPKY